MDEHKIPVRSTFLMVICILTFVGSAYGIFSGFVSVLTADQVALMTKQQTENAQQEQKKQELAGKSDAASKFAFKMMDAAKEFADAKKIKQSGIAYIVSNILTLGGAILMFLLKRIGFFVYVLGTIAGLAAHFFIYGTHNFLGNFSAIIGAFFGLVFIVMYAFNLKDMK